MPGDSALPAGSADGEQRQQQSCIDAHALRMYARTVSGANTATTATEPSSANQTSTPAVPVIVRSRAAVTRCEPD